MGHCQNCGDAMWSNAIPICSKCRKFAHQVQKDYQTRRSAPQQPPQRVIVQQPVYVPYPAQPQQGYMPQYPQQQQQMVSYPGYGLPPSVNGPMADDRVWHPVYFFAFGLWLALLLVVAFPFIYLLAIWRWGRVLLSWFLLGIW